MQYSSSTWRFSTFMKLAAGEITTCLLEFTLEYIITA